MANNMHEDAGGFSPIKILSVCCAIAFLMNVGFSVIVGSEIKSQLEAQQREQQAIAHKEEVRTCHDLGSFAALKPPVGDPSTNPSRKFDQGQHAIYVKLYTDAECNKF